MKAASAWRGKNVTMHELAYIHGGRINDQRLHVAHGRQERDGPCVSGVVASPADDVNLQRRREKKANKLKPVLQ
jgi:hypothetical protein